MNVCFEIPVYAMRNGDQERRFQAEEAYRLMGNNEYPDHGSRPVTSV